MSCDLREANAVARRVHARFDAAPFAAVCPLCHVLASATAHGFVGPLSVALGASFLQRVLRRTDEWRAEARRLGVVTADRVRFPPVSTDDAETRALALMYVVCVGIAAKSTDSWRYEQGLSVLARAVMGTAVDPEVLRGMERETLRVLDWRVSCVVTDTDVVCRRPRRRASAGSRARRVAPRVS